MLANAEPPLKVGAGRSLSLAEVLVIDVPNVSKRATNFFSDAAESELPDMSVSDLAPVSTGSVPSQNVVNQALVRASSPSV